MSLVFSSSRYETVIENTDNFLKLLHDLASMGAAMRSIMTKALTDEEVMSR